MEDEQAWLKPYEGNDMASFLLQCGWGCPPHLGSIRSITNVRDTAIIVTDRGVWRVRPCERIGFCVEVAAYF